MKLESNMIYVVLFLCDLQEITIKGSLTGTEIKHHFFKRRAHIWMIFVIAATKNVISVCVAVQYSSAFNHLELVFWGAAS